MFCEICVFKRRKSWGEDTLNVDIFSVLIRVGGEGGFLVFISEIHTKYGG